jgi:hypothetical protein
MKKGAVIGIIMTAVLALFYGCEFFVGPDAPFGGGNLVVSAGTGGARAAYSDEEINGFRYVFTFTGPGGDAFSAELPPGAGTLNISVALGEWIIEAKAYNDDNVLMGTGSLSYTVKVGSNSVKIPMTAVGSIPTYTISGTIRTNDPDAPAVEATVQLKQGASNVGSSVTSGGDGSYTISGVPADTGYTIEAALTGYTTGTSSAFDVSGNVTGQDLTLVRMFNEAITLTITDVGDGSFSQASFTINKSGTPNSDSQTVTITGTGYTNIRWFVDGVQKGTENSVTVNAANYMTGGHSLSLLVDKGGASWSKSIDFTVEN